MSTVDYSLDRGLPASPEVERSLLGAILLDNTLHFDAAQSITADDFSLDGHRIIFDAFVQLADSGKPVDIVSLTEHLVGRRLLDAVGGCGYLASLTDGVPRRSSLAHYINIVREKATMRRLIHAGNAIVTQGIEQRCSADEALAEAEESIFRIRAEQQQGTEPDLRDQCGNAIRRMESERTRADGSLLGLTTAVSQLDMLTTGICPGELWVIGAPPGRAKTAYALQIARANAQIGIGVGMLSLEMNDYPVLKRCAAAVSGVPASKFKDAKRMSPDEYRAAQEAYATIAQWPLVLDDRRISSVQQAIARARLYVRRKHIKLLIVDHLLALSAHAHERDQRMKVTTACNALREFAKDEKVGVIVLHHLKRPVNQNDRPTLFDLKESGDVEGFAHVVLLLYRPIDDHSEFTGVDEIVMAKIRDGGEPGTVPVTFNKRNLEFEPDYQPRG